MTLEQQQARLALYLAAEAKILEGQEYTIGDGSTARRLRRADLAEVRAEIERLSAAVERLQGAATRTRRVFHLR